MTFYFSSTSQPMLHAVDDNTTVNVLFAKIKRANLVNFLKMYNCTNFDLSSVDTVKWKAARTKRIALEIVIAEVGLLNE